jgi:uncharacterized protein
MRRSVALVAHIWEGTQLALAADELDDQALIDAWKNVRLDHINKNFYRGLLAKELRLNRCADCGWWHHRPKPVCPNCWSHNLVATPVKGTGTIHLLIFLYQGPPAEGVDYTSPHPVAAVELDEQEGLRFTSTVVGAENDEIAVGKRVQLDWTERNGQPYPVWRLSDEGANS